MRNWKSNIRNEQQPQNSGKSRNVHILTGYDQEGSAGEAVGRALRELNSVSAYDSVLDEMAVMLTDIDGLLNVTLTVRYPITFPIWNLIKTIFCRLRNG